MGAAIGFMMWMWISAMVILAGAELDAGHAQKRSAHRPGRETRTRRRRHARQRSALIGVFTQPAVLAFGRCAIDDALRCNEADLAMALAGLPAVAAE